MASGGAPVAPDAQHIALFFDREQTRSRSAGSFYLLAAALPYYFWGSCTADTLTLNLMHSSPNLGSISTAAILANTFCSMALLCAPHPQHLGHSHAIRSRHFIVDQLGSRESAERCCKLAYFP